MSRRRPRSHQRTLTDGTVVPVNVDVHHPSGDSVVGEGKATVSNLLGAHETNAHEPGMHETESGDTVLVDRNNKMVVLWENTWFVKKGELSDLDLSGLDLSDRSLFHYHWKNVNFSGASLSSSWLQMASYENCVFDGSNLTETNFNQLNLSSCSLRNTNMVGASFNNGNLNGVDLSGSDVHSAQMFGADLRGVNWEGVTNTKHLQLTDPSAGRLAAPLPQYEKYSLSEAAAAMGMDDATIRVLMWVGEIEVRDNDTLGVVTENFDVEKHHVPAWQIQNPPLQVK